MSMSDVPGEPDDGRASDSAPAIDPRHALADAVVDAALPLRLRRALRAEGDTGGHTRTAVSSLVPTWDRIRDQVTVMLGGRAADVVLGSGPIPARRATWPMPPHSWCKLLSGRVSVTVWFRCRTSAFDRGTWSPPLMQN